MKNNQQNGNTTFLWLLVVFALLLFTVWYTNSPYFNFGKKDPTPEEEAALIAQGEERIIEITNKGFVPEIVEVHTYDTVTFVNHDTQASHWPESGKIDKDSSCEEFGSPQALNPFDQYSYVFTRAGSCNFHDKLFSFPFGSIQISDN
ncbi:MAG: hypothetical protein COU09_01250 [Candidatus Harrisonbacteria bacterium CG10_big_fil_rev_8_21_14_0_10_44_23]|uniref:EfeO-type cupredoxin-like domain-containing protein n=1 Tax=Candidatus Harrisonbacteria bacterium CG10_big_fil_rev_8_21_14_0_10_44_23 TaxID=1974585 RepID=A0A2H0UQB9_9BACT|nr:MAG: hypothetical protein COU09_01250 [Candidatus Harrisonbacteria bacterium CG10_big_fil_rev_8_21_14_0_10_44_23]